MQMMTAAAVAGYPDVITCGSRVNLFEAFSDESIVHARKMATVIWGDSSFICDGPMTIVPFLWQMAPLRIMFLLVTVLRSNFYFATACNRKF